MELKDVKPSSVSDFDTVECIWPESGYREEESLKDDFSNAIISGYYAEIYKGIEYEDIHSLDLEEDLGIRSLLYMTSWPSEEEDLHDYKI